MSQHAFDTRSACRKHPQNEVPSKTFQWRCAASIRDRSVVCGAAYPLSRLTRSMRSRLESSTKPVRDSQACSSTSTQRGSSGMDRQWCHSIFRHARVPNPSSSVFVGGGVGLPETRLVYTVPTQITDRNKLGV